MIGQQIRAPTGAGSMGEQPVDDNGRGVPAVSQSQSDVIDLPYCDSEGCDETVDYLADHGAFCEYHAWTLGVRR